MSWESFFFIFETKIFHSKNDSLVSLIRKMNWFCKSHLTQTLIACPNPAILSSSNPANFYQSAPNPASMNMAPSHSKADPNISGFNHGSQHLSSIPGPILSMPWLQGNCPRVLEYTADLRWNLEIHFLFSRKEVLTIFLANGKVPVTTGETREEGNILERVYLLLVTME